MVLERRVSRSEFWSQSLNHLFEKVVQSGEVEAFVLADEGGFLMAAMGGVSDPEAVAALSSMVFDFESRMRRYHLEEKLSEVTMRTNSGRVFRFRWVQSNSEALVLCGIRSGAVASDEVMEHAASSIQRILTPSEPGSTAPRAA